MIINHAYIEITNSCNLNCLSCYNKSGTTKHRKEISFEDYQLLFKRLVKEFGCTRITLSGGEPTLHSEFDKILSHSLQNPAIEINIITNGTIHNPYLFYEYFQNPNFFIQVSLDGSTEPINSAIRGDDNFNKTIAFLRRISNCYGKKPKVKMVISKINLSDVVSFYEFCVKQNYYPSFDFIHAMGNAIDNWETIALSAKDKLGVLRLIDNLNKKHCLNVPLPYCSFRCPLDEPANGYSILIKSNGTLQPCQLLYDGEYQLGNILTDANEKIDLHLQQIVNLVLSRQNTDFGCSRCVANAFCNKGCLALAVMNSKHPLGNDGNCEYRQLQLLGFHMLNEE